MGLDEIEVLLKLATSPKLDTNTLFQAVLGFENSSLGLNEIDIIFKLATLDDVDNVSNLNRSIWV